MLVTHYALTLAPAEIETVRQRIAVIGPDFDTLPGLVNKLFLLAADPPCYALYYLWQTPDALQAFLDGPLFAALVARFGRPTLEHYLTHATALPFIAGERIDCESLTEGSTPGEIELHDLRHGGRVTLRRAATGQFEVMYVAGANSSHSLLPHVSD